MRCAPEQAPVFNSLAWLLATCPDEEHRDGSQAVQHAIRACELTEWTNPHCLGTLAAAYAEMGEFPKAVRWQAEAIEAATADYDVAAAQRRLGLYKAARPYRQEP